MTFNEKIDAWVVAPPIQCDGTALPIASIAAPKFSRDEKGHLVAELVGGFLSVADVDYTVHGAVFDEAGRLLSTATVPFHTHMQIITYPLNSSLDSPLRRNPESFAEGASPGGLVVWERLCCERDDMPSHGQPSLPVARELVSKWSSTFRSMKLDFPEPGVACLRATTSARAVLVTIMLIGVGGFYVLGSAVGWSFGLAPDGARHPVNWLYAVSLAAPLVLTIMAALMLLGLVGLRPAVFNRRLGTAWRRRGWGKDDVRGELALDRIAAIQICSGIIDRTADSNFETQYTTFERMAGRQD